MEKNNNTFLGSQWFLFWNIVYPLSRFYTQGQKVLFNIKINIPNKNEYTIYYNTKQHHKPTCFRKNVLLFQSLKYGNISDMRPK